MRAFFLAAVLSGLGVESVMAVCRPVPDTYMLWQMTFICSSTAAAERVVAAGVNPVAALRAVGREATCGSRHDTQQVLMIDGLDLPVVIKIKPLGTGSPVGVRINGLFPFLCSEDS